MLTPVYQISHRLDFTFSAVSVYVKMFNFRGDNLKNLEEVRDFALNLVKKTRPYLSENQREIIVSDLLTRVEASNNLIYDTDAPFKFGKNKRIPRSRLSSTTTDKDSAVEETSPRITPTFNVDNKKRVVENRKRSHKSSNGFSSTPKVVQLHPRKNISTKENIQKRPSMYNRANSVHNSFVSDMKSGAPVIKKKKPVEEYTSNSNEENCVSITSVDRDETEDVQTKLEKIPDVFERLYASRKSTNVSCKKNILVQKCNETNEFKRPRSIGHDSSLMECIGSVQKALDNLKLLAN